jgi:hypothetical protein
MAKKADEKPEKKEAEKKPAEKETEKKPEEKKAEKKPAEKEAEEKKDEKKPPKAAPATPKPPEESEKEEPEPRNASEKSFPWWLLIVVTVLAVLGIMYFVYDQTADSKKMSTMEISTLDSQYQRQFIDAVSPEITVAALIEFYVKNKTLDLPVETPKLYREQIQEKRK